MKHISLLLSFLAVFSNLLSSHLKLKRSVKCLGREITKRLTHLVIIKIIREVMAKFSRMTHEYGKM